MALNTYTTLKAAIADYLDRPDLTNQIVDFISLAEARHRRDIRNTDMLNRSQATLFAQQTPYLALPVRFLQMRSMRLLTDPISILQSLAPEKLTQARALNLSTTYGQPSYYTVNEELEFDISPDEDYTVEMLYYAAYLPLSDADQQNALLLNNPDAYLYASLTAAEPFLVHDERVPLWEAGYQQAVEGIKSTERGRRHGVPIVARVYGGTP